MPAIVTDILDIALPQERRLEALFTVLAKHAARPEERYKMSVWAWQQTTLVSLLNDCLHTGRIKLPLPAIDESLILSDAQAVLALGWRRGLVLLNEGAKQRMTQYAASMNKERRSNSTVVDYLVRNTEYFMEFVTIEVSGDDVNLSLNGPLCLLGEEIYLC